MVAVGEGLGEVLMKEHEREMCEGFGVFMLSLDCLFGLGLGLGQGREGGLELDG